MTGDDSRHPNRRQLLGTLGASALALGVAGCIGDGGTTNPDGGDGDENGTTTETTTTGTATSTTTETPTETTTTTTTATETTAGTTATQQAVVNSVDGLEIVDHDGSVTDENYSVTVTVENAGDQTTDIGEYDFRVTLYDADGDEIQGAGGLVWGQEGDLAPGEQIEIRIESTVREGADPEDVDRYQVRLECGTFSEGVYCEN